MLSVADCKAISEHEWPILKEVELGNVVSMQVDHK